MKGKVLLAVGSVIVFAFMLSVGAAHAQRTMKFGAGVHLDENTPGIMAAVDIPLGDGVLGVSPFIDLFSKAGSQIISGGLNALIKKAEGKAWVYIGGGGGFGYIKSDAEYMGGGATQKVSASKTQGMANGIVGVEYWGSDKISVFAQARFIALFGGSGTMVPLVPPADSDGSTTFDVDLAVRSFAFQLGLSLKFGGSDDY
jgi:hypothetical protein